ncbi:Uncharacterised protein [Mycobacteroides abscessus subsp. abscessus]|nr:Uncharacterised protein [Mycobacteroides abscessus subsp. abscessus]
MRSWYKPMQLVQRSIMAQVQVQAQQPLLWLPMSLILSVTFLIPKMALVQFHNWHLKP